MSAKDRALDHVWVGVSYLLIAGGASLLAMVFAIMDTQGEVLAYLCFGAGALIGGFAAGRISPHRRLNETATAGVALVVTLVALSSTTQFGPPLWDDPAAEIWKRSLLLGGAALIGALVGTWLAHQMPARPSSSLVRWSGISFLAALGGVALAIFFVAAVLLRDSLGDDSELSNGGVVLILLAMAGGSALGAFVTQRLAPARMITIAALGGPLIMVVFGVMFAFDDDPHDGEAIFGILFLGLILFATSQLPARLGWYLRERGNRAARVPEAQVVDDD